MTAPISLPSTTPSLAPRTALAQVLRTFRWARPARVGALGLIAAAAVGWLGGPAGPLLATAVAGGTLLWLLNWIVGALSFIDRRIAAVLGSTHQWQVHSKALPLYKLVDLHHAAQTFVARHPGSVVLHSQHGYPLAGLVGGIRNVVARRLSTPTAIPRKVSADQEVYLPSDAFWLLPGDRGAGRGACVIRIWLPHRGALVQLEVAAQRAADATAVLEAIGEIAATESIYRGHTIRLVFNSEVRADYDEEESLDPMDVVFVRDEPVAEQDIILDARLQQVIERTIIDFHKRREQLMALGLPGKRGVLFYGPPGTGKTYTCKYIAQRLAPVTTLVVTGHALLHMKSICAFAKALQPALVLLEDVDLVFSHRETNAFNTVLGEFIDQLDGFGEADQVIFILTTNAIERIETAIKDRPGRVSQCLYFGPPSAVLRRRYLEALTRAYDVTRVRFERVVERTEGVSQAFLKELIFRAVQIASAADGAAGRPPLEDGHFEAALHEMTAGSGRAAQHIIGFRVEREPA